MFDEEFCNNHTGTLKICNNSVDCSIRSLWKVIQYTLDQVLERITLQDIVVSEEEATCTIQKIVEDIALETLNK